LAEAFEKAFVEINGARQGLLFKGKSLSNPVLLYVHGGMPDFILTQDYPTGLENVSPWCGGAAGRRHFLCRRDRPGNPEQPPTD